MANWDNPTLTSLYADFLTELKARDSDLAKMFSVGTPTNVETDTIRWNSSASRFQKWNGSAWVDLAGKYLINVDALDGKDYLEFAADPGGNGVIVRTAAFAAVARSIVGGVAIGVTNGSGVSGNPSIRVILGAGDRVLGRVSGGGDAQEIVMTAMGRSLMDDADAVAMRATLALGTAAVKNVGTSGDTIPKNDTANVFSAKQTIKATGNDAVEIIDDSFTGYQITSYRESEFTHTALNVRAARGSESSPSNLNSGDTVFTLQPWARISGNFTASSNWNLKAEWDGSAVGWILGDPTGGPKGAATLNAAGGFYDNGVLLKSGFTLATDQSTSSGASKTFGGIPAGVTMIVIMFGLVKRTTAGTLAITIGDAGGLETSGYQSVSRVRYDNITNSTTNFNIEVVSSGSELSGAMVLTLKNEGIFIWTETHLVDGGAGRQELMNGAGVKSLSAELTQLSISAPFNGGSINIMYI